MQGRYGFDKLNNTLFALFILIWFINIFVRNPYARIVMLILEALTIVLLVFRMMSRNINKRAAENRKFAPVYDAVVGFFKLNYRKFKDRKEYRYIKCPICKAQLRVRNTKGKHTVRCPKCGSEFEKKI